MSDKLHYITIGRDFSHGDNMKVMRWVDMTPGAELPVSADLRDGIWYFGFITELAAVLYKLQWC